MTISPATGETPSINPLDMIERIVEVNEWTFDRRNEQEGGRGYRATMMRSWPDLTGLPFSTRYFTIVHGYSALISLKTFMASIMQITWPGLTCSPSLQKGGLEGDGAR